MNKPIIMVVEDNQTTQETLKRDLELLGLDVLIYYSAEDAWKVLENGTNPDVLILDFNLPGGEDGPSLFRRIILDPRFKTLSIIPFTALIDQSDRPTNSMVSDFVILRGTRSDNIHNIISKKGREDVFNTPPDLILAIAHALQYKNCSFPVPFRAEVKKCIEALLKKMDDEGKANGG